jgi:hypothetical protein
MTERGARRAGGSTLALVVDTLTCTVIGIGIVIVIVMMPRIGMVLGVKA